MRNVEPNRGNGRRSREGNGTSDMKEPEDKTQRTCEPRRQTKSLDDLGKTRVVNILYYAGLSLFVNKIAILTT